MAPPPPPPPVEALDFSYDYCSLQPLNDLVLGYNEALSHTYLAECQKCPDGDDNAIKLSINERLHVAHLGKEDRMAAVAAADAPADCCQLKQTSSPRTQTLVTLRIPSVPHNSWLYCQWLKR